MNADLTYTAPTRRIARPAPAAPPLPRGWDRCTMPPEVDGDPMVPTLVHAEAIAIVGADEHEAGVAQLEIIASYTEAAGSALEDLGRWLRAGGRL